MACLLETHEIKGEANGECLVASIPFLPAFTISVAHRWGCKKKQLLSFGLSADRVYAINEAIRLCS